MRWFGSTVTDRVHAVTQRQRVYLDVRWLAESQPGLGDESEEGHARQPKNQRRGRSVWTPADIVDLKTLQEGWAYVMPYGSPEAGKALLPTDLQIDSGPKCHMAWLTSLGNDAPIGIETSVIKFAPRTAS